MDCACAEGEFPKGNSTPFAGPDFLPPSPTAAADGLDLLAPVFTRRECVDRVELAARHRRIAPGDQPNGEADHEGHQDR